MVNHCSTIFLILQFKPVNTLDIINWWKFVVLPMISVFNAPQYLSSPSCAPHYNFTLTNSLLNKQNKNEKLWCPQCLMKISFLIYNQLCPCQLASSCSKLSGLNLNRSCLYLKISRSPYCHLETKLSPNNSSHVDINK